MQNAKPYWPLIFLGIIQIGTAIFFMLPDKIVQIFGFKTLADDVLVYLYVVCSLYFSLGILYIMGGVNEKIRFSALLIACIDIPLEVLSYWAGFPKMHLPYWEIILVSTAIFILCLPCYVNLSKNYINSHKLMPNKEVRHD